MDYGIELVFVDDTKEWFDPVTEQTEDDVIINDGLMRITVGCNEYYYDRQIVKSITFYKLCTECGYDTRDHRYNCSWLDC